MSKLGSRKTGKNEKSKESENTPIASTAVTQPASPITTTTKSTDIPSTSLSKEFNGSATSVTEAGTKEDTNAPPVTSYEAQLKEKHVTRVSDLAESILSKKPENPEMMPATAPTAPVTESATPAKSSGTVSGSHCTTTEPCYVKFAPDAPQCRSCRYHTRDKK
jgi:hypothetical protein